MPPQENPGRVDPLQVRQIETGNHLRFGGMGDAVKRPLDPREVSKERICYRGRVRGDDLIKSVSIGGQTGRDRVVATG